MGISEISNAQQFNSVKSSFTARNQVQYTLCCIPHNCAPRSKVSGKRIACTAEPLYSRKTVLCAAEPIKPGFLRVVSNGQIHWCLKGCKLLFSHTEVLTLQHGFAFNISLPKVLGRGRMDKSTITESFSCIQLAVFRPLTGQLYVCCSW